MKNLIDTMKNDEDFDLTYLSLGAGVQSSALLVLSCTDPRVPKCDIAVFADTGDEPAYVYEYLDRLKQWAKPYGVELIIAQKGKMSDLVLDLSKDPKKYVNVPFYTKNADGSQGMLRRTCTRQFKITPIIQAVRTHLGYKPKQRVKHKVRCMMGISLDEIQRMKESVLGWQHNAFPLIDLSIKRGDCYKIVEDVGLPRPKKSACVYCPYHDDSYWQWMKDEQPDEFQEAVRIDEGIRNNSIKKEHTETFVHPSCVPLKDVVFGNDPNQEDMFNNECDGMCGV